MISRNHFSFSVENPSIKTKSIPLVDFLKMANYYDYLKTINRACHTSTMTRFIYDYESFMNCRTRQSKEFSFHLRNAVKIFLQDLPRQYGTGSLNRIFNKNVSHETNLGDVKMTKFKNVNDVIWKAEIKGDTITGMLMGVKPFVPPKGMKKKGDVNQYNIVDVEGVEYSMIGGVVLDKLVGEESEKALGRIIEPGDVVRFIFQGMRTSKGGDEYKAWAVQMIPKEELSDNWHDDIA